MNKKTCRSAILMLNLLISACAKDVTIPVNDMVVSALHTPKEAEVLPLGQKASVNAHSSIRYRTDHYILYLRGEGYFSADSTLNKRKLMVRYAPGEISCDNCEFDLDTYTYETLDTSLLKNAHAKLTIVRGPLRLTAYGRDTMLNRGVYRVGREGIYLVNRWKMEEQGTWVDGYYSFKVITIADLSALLSRHYELVDAHYPAQDVHTELTNIHVQLDTPLEDQVAAWSNGNNFIFDYSGQVLTISKK